MSHLRNLIVDGRVKKALFLIDNQQLSATELTQQDPENNTPLHWAVKLQYPELIQRLLQTPASICKSVKNKQGLTPYQLAKQKKGLPTRVLLKLRVSSMLAANADHLVAQSIRL